MVEIKPFCGWRYDPNCVDLADVIAPPYDVIDEKEQDALYEKNPYNIIRLILGKDELVDTSEGTNKYKRAGSFLESWQKQGIVINEGGPAYYLYRQTFLHPNSGRKVNRIGLFAAVRLEDYSARAILPHERTYTAPKADRMNLIRSVKANLSPVFGLYEDKGKHLDSLYKAAMKNKADISFEDDKKMSHSLWILKDKEFINCVSEFFKSQSVMIADGHHRYETALAYRNWLRDSGNAGNRLQASDYVMMVLVNIYDEGLLVFPTHRLLRLKALPDIEKLEPQIAPYFGIHGFSVNDAKDWESHLSQEPQDHVVIGLQWGKSKARILRLRTTSKFDIRRVMPAGKPAAWYRLDVNIVQHLIIHKLLGVKPKEFEEVVRYTHYLDEVVKRVQSGEATIAIILRAPDVATVKKVCYSGEVMPQKSTYFYPKLPSGLVLHMHEGR
ncbi:MAG: DUF1015 domain-containing protein [Candidatus Omnitrophica bacterium]|nr:DUF1015 domain-containing protein [Candidatus Omnitrophota bacterium]